jgi:hypothetical protein
MTHKICRIDDIPDANDRAVLVAALNIFAKDVWSATDSDMSLEQFQKSTLQLWQCGYLRIHGRKKKGLRISMCSPEQAPQLKSITAVSFN